MMKRIYKEIGKIGINIDKYFHLFRQPITLPICRFLTLLHIKPSYITTTRIPILIGFVVLWVYEQYHIAVILLAINIFLDIIDGDLARFLDADSEVRKFKDVTVDNIMVVALPLALIWQGTVSGFIGGYYIFIVTLSWWLSVVRRNIDIQSDWLFKAQASSFLFTARFFIVTLLVFLYVLFEVDVFSLTLIVLSVILTLNSINNYRHIVKSKTRRSEKEWNST
ncbi:MAG TPA: hypothetical protein G4O15_12500 [Dehalococcoidia bacterium]|nr:hypothetical protein [Dehalococcoidia bacterium]